MGGHQIKVVRPLEEDKEKAATQIGALHRATASTWGASFLRARQVYSAVVRPA
jgi:hypothetical protein